MKLSAINMSLPGLRAHYENGDFTPAQLVAQILAEARDDSNPIWIHLLAEEEVKPYVEALKEESPSSLPLYGIPFAIKDNIDLQGVPTTAACPDFSYVPEQSAFVVQRLIDAGAIPIGKTNMDQFATGLVGLRSPAPWGPCHNVFNKELIPGGSSSGSALAVAKAWVSFALGTDTAGSGRVPAALNNIVGLKASRGLISCSGVVPACRSLDCVSIFALTVSDAKHIADHTIAFDPNDAYSRRNLHGNGPRYLNSNTGSLRIGVPNTNQLEFFGDKNAEELFAKSLVQLEQLGHELVAIDFDPFVKAARLLYEGPWVTERYLAIRQILESKPDSLLPVIREIIGAGANKSAVETFNAQYELQTCAQAANLELDKVDAVITPTVGTVYSSADVEAEPIALNSRLGYYTNFMNLLDCAAVAVPAGFFEKGAGFGVTFFHRAFSDARLLSLAAQWQEASDLTLGATQLLAPISEQKIAASNAIKVVVCGAHMEGLALNWQLLERGGRKLQATHSAPYYRLFALSGGPPKRPGMLRVAEHGRGIEVEVWSLPQENFGNFVAEIPYPLGIGKVELVDGSWEPGFVCDANAIADAQDISHFGGWRAYLESV